MFSTLRNALKIMDLRKKILYTVFILVIFRLGSAAWVPFVDAIALKEATSASSDTFMSYLSLLSGGGFSNASIFSLGIQPYINASIIIQLLTVAIPALERMAKEGDAGRKKLGQITRFVTVGLGLLLGVAYYFMIRNNYRAVQYTSGWQQWFAGAVIVLCFTAGSALVMWLGEQINERGIGNGISLILFAGILSRLPNGIMYLKGVFWDMGMEPLLEGTGGGNNTFHMLMAPVIVILMLAMVALIVLITEAERRIPVQYAKRVVGRKMYGGQSTFIPIKVNMSGVMPIILASSIIQLPGIIQNFFGIKATWFVTFASWFKYDHWVYVVLYFFMIIGFAFFYVTIQYNPLEMANNLRKNSGAIPGYRPGRPTTDYIKRVLNKVTLIGAIFLGFIALFPSLFGMATGLTGVTLGGTSIMIVVGVALETMQQIESQMTMRHYKGFLE